MKRLELVQTPNRRMSNVDRRYCMDRRRCLAREANTIDSVETLRELLDDAHARIRMLQRAVDTLRKST